MNENVGKSIKRWAKALFIISLILLGIGLFVLLVASIAADDEMAAAIFFLLPPIGAIGFCFVRVCMLVLYGFGELVDRAVSQDNKMPKLKYVQQPAPQPAPVAGVCPGCGHQNPADAKFCENCGAKLGE
jgi:hypothetical protein